MKSIEYLYLVILFITALYSVFTLRKGVFIIKLYVIVTLLTEVAGYGYLYYYNHAFAMLYNIFSLFEIGIWLGFYFQVTHSPRNWVLVVISGVYLLLFLYLGKFEPLSYNHQGVLLNNLIVTFLIARYLYYILQKNLDLNGYFIIMVGAMFYHTGGFLLNGMIKIIAHTDLNVARKLYSINSVLNILFYGFILWGLISTDRETRISPSVRSA